MRIRFQGIFDNTPKPRRFYYDNQPYVYSIDVDYNSGKGFVKGEELCLFRSALSMTFDRLYIYEK